VLAALDVLPDASIMVFDLDLVFVVVRGEALKDAGMDPHDLEERPAAEALSPSRWAFYEPFYRAALAGESSSIEVGSVAGDGRRYVVNVGPVRDRTGEVIGGVAIATDVSEHLRMRAALEESEARFRLVAENASDIVLRVDDAWDVGWVSPSVHEVLGYKADEALGASLRSFMTDESWATIRAAYASWDKADPLRVQLQLVASDGSLRWMEVVARSIGDHRGASTVVNLRDVDAQVHAQQALAESEEQFRLTMEQAAVGMALVSASGHFVVVNPALSRFLGYEEGELAGRSFLTVTHPDDIEPGSRVHERLVSGEMPSYSVRKRYVRKDGHTVWADLTVAAVRDAQGSFRHNVAQMADVTAEVLAQEAAEESQRLYRLLAENASDVVYLADPSGSIVWASPSFASVLGIDPVDAVGMRTEDLVHPDDLARVQRRRAEIYSGERPGDAIVRFRSGTGEYLDMSVTVHVLSEGGTTTGAVVGLRDVTVEQRALRQLARSEERFRLAMTAAPVGMAISDPDGRFVQVNDAFCDLVGLPESDVLGATVSRFLGPGDHDLVDTVTAALSEEGASTFRHQHRLMSGSRELWVEHSASVLRDDEGRPVFYVHQFADHTEAHELRQDLEYRAAHDPLTGVANRGELMRQLRHALRRGRGGATWLGVLFCDIDNLKPLNDEYGHATGDAAIVAVAERLTGVVRVIDLVARIGGDEFVILLEGLRSRDELRAIAEKCRRAVEGPIESEGQQVLVSVSVGAVLADQDETPDEVLARADHALHRAKEGGRRQVDLD
jgi:diguanylate cyclase (GGDEF)-like protein/PAS domain S-box-containing protein